MHILSVEQAEELISIVTKIDKNKNLQVKGRFRTNYEATISGIDTLNQDLIG